MLLGRDTDNISNLNRDRASSFRIGQIEDDYETEPLVSKQQFFKRIRGRKGAFPPSKRTMGKKDSSGSEDKIPVYCCAQVNELTTIDTKSNTFTARLSLMLIFDINIAKTTSRLQEELQECLDDPSKDTMREDRQRKEQLWSEIVENSVEDGTPYKIEDEEYELFEEEIEWPESLELFNKITEDQTEEPTFVILRTHPENPKSPAEVQTATVLMEFMEGLYECKEYQELEFFPFDLQDLTLDFQLTARTDIDKFDFRLHTVEFYRPCLQMAEWVMYPPDCDRKGTAKTSVRLRATRKSRYYITNIVGMMCILNCMCIAAFGIEVPDIADRLSVTMTMMLTAVAFKFIVGDQLPKVSYNTYLDFYLLYTMFFMFLCSIYFCIAPHMWKSHFDVEDIGGEMGDDVLPEVRRADRVVCYILTSIFTTFTGYWFWGAYWVVREIQNSLPPPIALEEGDEYVSYRWQKVPFKGFENPLSERERDGKSPRRPDPENVDRMLSMDTYDNIETEEVDKKKDIKTPADADKKIEMTGGAITDGVQRLEVASDDRDSDAHSPSTYEIQAGTLPTMILGKEVSAKRGPESPAT